MAAAGAGRRLVRSGAVAEASAAAKGAACGGSRLLKSGVVRRVKNLARAARIEGEQVCDRSG